MLTKQSHYYDNTRIATYKENPREYFLRHVLHWTVESSHKAVPLVFGGSWHAGMDAVWGAGVDASNKDRVELAMINFRNEWELNNYKWNLSLEEQEELGARTPGTAHEMYYNYIAQREAILKNSRTLGIEQPIAMPFPDMKDTWYVGKLDKVIEYNGMIHILEHKTTSIYRIKGNFDNDYLESWNTASQVKGYQMAGSIYYPKLQDVWVDCALVHKKVHDGFKFVPVSHRWELLKSWITSTRRWIEEIQRETEEYERVGDLSLGTFRMNDDACYTKYGRSPFLDIYTTIDDPSKLDGPPPGYMVEKWEPFDMLKLDQLVHKAGE